MQLGWVKGHRSLQAKHCWLPWLLGLLNSRDGMTFDFLQCAFGLILNIHPRKCKISTNRLDIGLTITTKTHVL